MILNVALKQKKKWYQNSTFSDIQIHNGSQNGKKCTQILSPLSTTVCIADKLMKIYSLHEFYRPFRIFYQIHRKQEYNLKRIILHFWDYCTVVRLLREGHSGAFPLLRATLRHIGVKNGTSKFWIFFN